MYYCWIWNPIEAQIMLCNPLSLWHWPPVGCDPIKTITKNLLLFHRPPMLFLLIYYDSFFHSESFDEFYYFFKYLPASLKTRPMKEVWFSLYYTLPEFEDFLNLMKISSESISFIWFIFLHAGKCGTIAKFVKTITVFF